MWWILGVIVVGYILIRFFSDLNKDKDDLRGNSLDQKFSIIVSMLNESAFEGKGRVTIIDSREFNLYEVGQNQIVKFLYGTGHLTLEWKFKYFQKETIYKHQYNNVRNLSIFEQEKIANHFIKEALFSFEKHKLDVVKDSVDTSGLLTSEKQKISKVEISKDNQIAAMMYLLMLLSAADLQDNKLNHINNVAKTLNFDLEGKSMAIYSDKNADYAYSIIRSSPESLKSVFSYHLLSIIKFSGEPTDDELTLLERIVTECDISEETFNSLNGKRLN